MTLMHDYREPTAEEASENLRVIRELMERSTRHSTFSGLSGILAGAASIAGCVATRNMEASTHGPIGSMRFLLTWALVILFALSADYLLTKRQARGVGKRILSRLGKQMAYASLPGLGSGALFTLLLLRHHLLSDVYGVWMLCYGTAVCSVGLFSQREVKLLGVAFLTAGALTLLIPQIGLGTMAVSFGGFHIVYGLAMAGKDGW